MITNLTYNADVLFIEYDDMMRSPALAFIKGARTSGQMRELFDFSAIDSLDDVGLTEWYWFRFNKNPLMDLNPSVSEEIADDLLKSTLSNPDCYFLYEAALPLHIAGRIKSFITHKIVKKIVVWSPYVNPNIKRSLNEEYKNLPIIYMPGKFKDVVRRFSKDATYMISDINHIVELDEIKYLNMSSIILGAYRYNMMKSDMNRTLFDFEEYMKDHNVVFKYAFWNPSKAPIQDENQASS